jgi:hypothetical protein
MAAGKRRWEERKGKGPVIVAVGMFIFVVGQKKSSDTSGSGEVILENWAGRT